MPSYGLTVSLYSGNAKISKKNVRCSDINEKDIIFVPEMTT